MGQPADSQPTYELINVSTTLDNVYPSTRMNKEDTMEFTLDLPPAGPKGSKSISSLRFNQSIVRSGTGSVRIGQTKISDRGGIERAPSRISERSYTSNRDTLPANRDTLNVMLENVIQFRKSASSINSNKSSFTNVG